MKPYYEKDGVTLYHGDCLDVLREMESGSVGAVVTDPPYGIGFNYSGKKEVASNPEDYWSWLEPIYQAFLRCLKPGGFCAIWQTQLNYPHFWKWFGEDIRIYAACKNFVQLRKTPINYGYDPVIMFHKKGAETLRPSKPRRNIDFFVANTASIVSDPLRPERQHPCPRPLDQTQEIIDNFVAERSVVLDPFVGSGTTAVACVQTGRKFIGIEIEERYCEIAVKRLEQDTPLFPVVKTEEAEKKLFDDAPSG